MRTVTDEAGRVWDVAVGKESWGTLVLLFSSRNGEPPRRFVLGVDTAFDASRELASLTEAELRERLASAQPW